MGNNVLGANRLGERLSNPGSMPDLGGVGNQPGLPLGQTGGDQNTGGLISGMIGNMPPGQLPQLPPPPVGDLNGAADKLRGAIRPPMPIEGGGLDRGMPGGNMLPRPLPRPMPQPLGMPGGNMLPQPPSGDMSNPVAKQPVRRMPRQPNQEAGRRRINMF